MFSGDTTVNDSLIALAKEADILVHCVADLGYLERHGTTGVELEHMAGLHTDVTEVGGVAALCPQSVSSSSPITFLPTRTPSAKRQWWPPCGRPSTGKLRRAATACVASFGSNG